MNYFEKSDRFYLVIFLTYMSIVCVISQDSCYQDDPHESFYGTETLYSEGRKLIQLRNGNENYMVPNCEPVQLQLFVRHGTRYPSSKDISLAKEYLYDLRDSINENYNNGRTRVCGEDLALLRSWKLTYNESKAKMLTARGEREIRSIADNYQRNFQDLLRPSFSDDDYVFRHTHTLRTKMSAKSFAMELFGRKVSEEISYKNTGKTDPLLRPYRHCSSWSDQVLQNASAHREIDKFQVSDTFKDMIEEVSNRLGFQKPLTMETVLLMQLICRFEYGVNEGSSPWCIAFTRKDIKVIEYYYDLQYWWLHGYGYQVNREQICKAMKEIIGNLDIASKAQSLNRTVPRAIFSFTHSKFILRLYSMFGLFKDGPENFKMTAEDFGRSFKWRLSAIDPVAANLGIVLYKCPHSDFKVKVLVQEKPMKIPGCDGYVCDLNTLKKLKNPFVDACEYNSICFPTSSQVSKLGSSGSNCPRVMSLIYLFMFLFYISK